jgi:TRAP-type C4-dicarboxylate transport system permease small subunit
MDTLEKSIQFLSEKMRIIGAFFLFGMAVLTCADIIGRLFKHPIFGSVELVSFMAVFAVATAMPYAQLSRIHIGVELLVKKLPRKLRLSIELSVEVLSLALFSMISWRMFLFGLKQQASGEVSLNLHLPEYIIILVLACCCVILCLVMVMAIAKTFTKFWK